MTEPEDILVGAEFAAYREGLLDAVRPVGPTAVRAAVRRRRRRTAVVAATTVALAVAVPVVANAALRPPPARPAETPTPVAPTPSATTGPSATATPGPSAPAPTSASATPAVPDGRLTRAELLTNRVDVPAWRPGVACPAGPTRLVDAYRQDGDVMLEGLAHGDVDGDGAVETVVLLRCGLGSKGPSQVVALDRDDDGRVVTLGQVIRSAYPIPEWLLAVEVRDDGTVRVEMADIAPGGGWALEWSQRQWRGYRWSDGRFGQVSGETTFGPNPHQVDLEVSASPLAWGPKDAEGVRTGTVTVTVHNHSRFPAVGATVVLTMQPRLRAEGVGWSACVDGPPPQAGVDGTLTCRLGTVEAGASRTLKLGLVDRHNTSGTGLVSVEPVGGTEVVDPNWENNEGRFRYR